MAITTVTFPESTTRNQSKVVNLPNLKSIKSITVNTGNVTYSVSGNDITINVSNGAYTRYTSNTYTPSEYVTSYSDSYTNSFPATKSVTSPSGYTGSIPKSGSSYVVSGSPPSSDSKSASTTASASMVWRFRWTGSSWAFDDSWVTPGSVSYTDGQGYSGTLNYASYNGSIPSYPPDSAGAGLPVGSTTTRSTSSTANYTGTISKSTPDTRVYRQDYAGTVNGPQQTITTYYYAYTVTIDYLSNIGVFLFKTKAGTISIPVYEPSQNMPLRAVIKGGKVVSFDTTDPANASASPLRVATKNGIVAITKL